MGRISERETVYWNVTECEIETRIGRLKKTGYPILARTVFVSKLSQTCQRELMTTSRRWRHSYIDLMGLLPTYCSTGTNRTNSGIIQSSVGHLGLQICSRRLDGLLSTDLCVIPFRVHRSCLWGEESPDLRRLVCVLVLFVTNVIRWLPTPTSIVS